MWLNEIIFFLIWVSGWVFWYYFFYKKKLNELKKQSDWIDEESKKIINEAEKKAKEIIRLWQFEIDKKQQKIDSIEERLFQKEEKIDKKLESLEQEKDIVKAKQEELKNTIEEGKKRLSELSKLTPEEAKQKFFDIIERDNKEEIVKFINKFKLIKEEEADTVAANIVSEVLPKIWIESVSEFTVSDILLPSEDIKWKIIWREWRNISFFERVTGVELIIDDTPMTVRLSSFDPEKRFLAVETLKRLIKDGRINPVYVEKTYEEVSAWFENLLKKKWEETLASLNIPMMNPDVLLMIWKYHLRYSYGQNLLIHSLEVAKISEIIANELWFDGMMAKKAWLLHDIGKVVDSNLKAHSKVGAEFLRKYWFNEIIVNAAEWHHHDVPLKHPIWWIITAADAISAWRPWARLNTKDLFIERMENLEKLIVWIEWVEKTYIMQAWREIMAFVNPTQISDIALEKTAKIIWKAIESQLDYPWVIRVMVVRETKVIDYLT